MEKGKLYNEVCARLHKGNAEDHTHGKNYQDDIKILASLPVNHPSGFDDLTEEEQESLVKWIRENFSPTMTVDPVSTSYGYKHMYQRDSNRYVTNGQFKGAMLVLGHKPVDEAAFNWSFRGRMKRYSSSNTRG